MDIYRVGQRIRSLRLEQGMTQEMLAETADLSVPYVSHIERGAKKASLETLIQIAAALGVTVDRLLAGVQETDQQAFLPEVCDLLSDCSVSERYAIFETSKALKQALRDKFVS